jgi:hypothetical protein
VSAQKLNLLSGNQLLVWHKKFEPDQNILGPLEGGLGIT